jgi:hypothetical protein
MFIAKKSMNLRRVAGPKFKTKPEETNKKETAKTAEKEKPNKQQPKKDAAPVETKNPEGEAK